MDTVIIQSLRKAHGLTAEQLPDDATEDQIKAAIQAQADPPPASSPSAPAVVPQTPPASPPGPAQPGNDPGGGPPSPDQVPSGPGPGRLEAEPALVAAGMVAVPVAQWEVVQAGAQLAVRQQEENEKAADSRILGDALRAGKVAPAHQQSYLNGLNNPATRAQFRHLLTAEVKDGGLAPNIVPVSAAGIDPSTMEPQGGPAYPTEWLPELQNRDATVTNYVTVEA